LLSISEAFFAVYCPDFDSRLYQQQETGYGLHSLLQMSIYPGGLPTLSSFGPRSCTQRVESYDDSIQNDTGKRIEVFKSYQEFAFDEEDGEEG